MFLSVLCFGKLPFNFPSLVKLLPFCYQFLIVGYFYPTVKFHTVLATRPSRPASLSSSSTYLWNSNGIHESPHSSKLGNTIFQTVVKNSFRKGWGWRELHLKVIVINSKILILQDYRSKYITIKLVQLLNLVYQKYKNTYSKQNESSRLSSSLRFLSITPTQDEMIAWIFTIGRKYSKYS